MQRLIQIGFVDPKRIGMTGWSYGGYMTIHSLLLAPDNLARGGRCSGDGLAQL